MDNADGAVMVEGEELEDEVMGRDEGEEKISEEILEEDMCIVIEANKKTGRYFGVGVYCVWIARFKRLEQKYTFTRDSIVSTERIFTSALRSSLASRWYELERRYKSYLNQSILQGKSFVR